MSLVKSPIAAFWRTAALICATLPALSAAVEAPVAFRTTGGDAWTFEKKLEVSVKAGACDSVTMTSPLGGTTVQARNQHASARVLLSAGDNRVQAQCHVGGIPRGEPAEQHWFVRARDMPVARVRLHVTESEIVLDADASEPAPARVSPLATFAWRVRSGGSPAPLPGLPADGKHVSLAKPVIDGEYFVTLRVTDRLGRADESTAMFRVRQGRTEMVDIAREHAAWIDRAIVYGVEPHLFGKRGFADVTARLDAIAALGATTVWLTPITAAPTGDFGYAVTDHFRLREDFGSEAELRELIAQAHARGLRVILDLVANHFSEQHAYFADTASSGRASPYFDFFQRTQAGAPVHYFDWKNLKNLNFDSPEVQRLMIEACTRWVRDYDVDGFRVDAAWGPRERAPEFWPNWRTELKRIKPDLLLLAEASARDGYYAASGFDAAYDWTGELGHWAWQEAFADERRTAERLRAALRETQSLAGSFPVFRFLNNNDTGPRFITRHGAERTRVAAAMLLTLPGLPGLYSGDEMGAAFEPYHPQGPIAWNDAYGLKDWYTRLIALRAHQPALRSRELRVVDVAAADQVLAYLRPASERDAELLVLLNFGGAEATVTLPDELLRAGWHIETIDLLSNAQPVSVRAGPAIVVPGYSARVLQRSQPGDASVN
jgi:cyclomaltodextrinase / maltogenic alpha-amylase / neopullulanase